MSEVSAAAEVPIGDLRPHPRNPRTISDVRFDHLKRTLTAEREMLQARPLIARRDGTVIAGNQRLAAAQALGWESIPVVYADIDDEQAEKWMLLDNRGFGEDDVELLAGMLRDLDARGTDLAEAGYLEDDVAAILLAAQPKRTADPDAVPEPPVVPKSERGVVYQLGPHRVMCGDSFTSAASFINGERIAALVTDPPYGITLDTDYSAMPKTTRTYRPVEGDDQPFDAAPLRELLADVAEQFWFGADYYARTLGDTEHDGAWLIWDKRVEEAYDAGFGSCFEMCWSAQRRRRRILRHQWFQNHAEDPHEAGDRLHPTQKPLALLRELIEMGAADGEVVLDLFGGSGATLIAAEQTGRRALLIEIDPAYCDVIRQRYADYTGQPDLAP